MALTDPPRHRQLRGLVDEWFSVRSIRTFDPGMREVAHNVIDRALDLGSCDFVMDVAARIPLYVICNMMGVPREDWDYLFALTHRAFGAGDALTRRFAHPYILSYFEDLAAARAEKPADDLVSILATVQIDGKPLTTEEIILNCDNLLVGGTENTRIAGAGGMFALLEHPDPWDLLSADPGLLQVAVEEILRWTSSATHIMRTAAKPSLLRGRKIEAGDRVTMWIP